MVKLVFTILSTKKSKTKAPRKIKVAKIKRKSIGFLPNMMKN
jgi:hypothetical protein